MDQNELDFEKTLEDSKLLLEDASRVADDKYEFTLESILEEFGSAQGQKPAPVVPAPDPRPAVSIPMNAQRQPARPKSVAKERRTKEPDTGADRTAAAAAAADKPPDIGLRRGAGNAAENGGQAGGSRTGNGSGAEAGPGGPDDGGALGDIVPPVETPQSYSLQQVLSRTVQEVLDEQKSEPVLEEAPPRRSLFARRKKSADTEDFYGGAAQEDGADEEAGSGEKEAREKRPAFWKKKKKREPPPVEEPEEEEEEEEEEPPIAEIIADYRDAMQNTRRVARYASLVTLLMWVPPLLERLGWMPAMYTEEKLFHELPFLVALLLVCALGREVFLFGLEKLASLRVTYELLTALLCVAAAADTALSLLSGARNPQALPLHSIAALSMTSALWGRAKLFRALYDSFRVAAMGDPPYIVTTTAGGAAKRSGSMKGFIAAAERDDASGRWQTLVLPVILIGTLVFSVLATLECDSWTIYFWNLSAILAGADALAYPLVYSLPLRRLTKRFTASGSALAGYTGARLMCRSNCIILTDTDLFPRGTVSLKDLKVFGEDSKTVFSYAATMAHASDTGLARLFDNLLESGGGQLEPLSNLNFYEEGGVSGTIHGETVLFGTSSFCRRMGVPLPAGLSLKTGIFLAVDGTLIAIFAVKYLAAKSVDWAMHALGRAHITPVLAVRDGNITPELLKRKFGTDARAVYPQLSTRVAFSEKNGSKPCALIYREGLLPYAELVVGSKRLCRAVRIGTFLSLIASAAGTMISFYLSFVSAYTLLTPCAMLAFMCLWAVAALIDGVFVDKY